jgi:hypothetical protein
MSDTEEELSSLVIQFKEKLVEMGKREEEWKQWLEKMEAYMSHGLFDKKYKGIATRPKR